MDPALKHRLIGAAVLSALAVIFLPMLMVGHDTNDTASRVPLKVPTAPAGDFQTKELPLVTPAPGVPSGGVVGMDTTHPVPAASSASAASQSADASGPESSSGPQSPSNPAASGATIPAPAASGPANAASPAASPAASTAGAKLPAPAASGKTVTASPAVAGTPPPVANPASPATAPKPAAGTASPLVPVQPAAVASPAVVPNQPSGPVPAANSGGHYVVSLGTYSSAANAQSLVASLNARQLPAFAETVTVAGKSATRVRIGPFQQRGDAESARLKAQQVRTDMPASVTALDAAVPAPATSPPATTTTAGKNAAVASTKPATAASSPAVKPAPTAVASGKNATVPVAVASSSANDKASAPSPAAAARGYAVQVSAFRSEAEALTLRNKLRAAGFTAFSEKVQAESGTLFRVRIGPEANRDEADHLRTELSARLGLSGMVVAYP